MNPLEEFQHAYAQTWLRMEDFDAWYALDEMTPKTYSAMATTCALFLETVAALDKCAALRLLAFPSLAGATLCRTQCNLGDSFRQPYYWPRSTSDVAFAVARELPTFSLEQGEDDMIHGRMMG